ncbi:MAG: metallophosphoesterase [Tyzzerella sp.]|nr:metallophosphoesterase [Tyzzerella sp.]
MEKTKKMTTKKVIAILAAIFLLCGGALALLVIARNYTKTVASEEKYEYFNPDETKAEPDDGFVIDGVLDEEQYKKCNWLKLKNDQGGAGVDLAMTSFYGKKGMYIVYDISESSPIYVNLERESYMNSGVEMYLALSDVTSMASNKIFEIDLLPTGDMNFRQRTGKENWVNVASSDDIMAYLGATTKGGAVNTEECNGYNLELFIPWDYMDKLGMNASEMQESFVYINPVHITSYSLTGTNAGTDRYWYAFATQLGSDGWNDVAQYFRFGERGVLGTVPVKLVEGENYTITGNDSVIPGMMTTVTITPEDGYALNSILVNGEEYIKKVAYNEDGSVTLKLRGVKEGLVISASAEAVTDGNKTLSGTVQVHKLGGDTLEGVSLSYKGPGGEKPITFDSNGKFELKDLKQGYYIITAEKKGYAPINRGICLNRNIETELVLEYQMFEAETGYNWILDDQNDGVLNRFGGSGKILSVDSYKKFAVEANFKYDTELAAMSDGDTFLQQRSGIQIKFSNGKFWRVDLMKEKDVFKVQYAKHNTATVFDWKTVHELTEKEIAQYQSEEGIKLSILRDGNYAWVCLNDKPVAVEVLDDEYKNCTAQIGFEGWVANQEIEEMNYSISTSFKQNLKNFYFTTSGKWDISRQLEGVVSLPGGGTHVLPFYKEYTDIDLTLKNVKEHDATGKKPGRTDVLFEFDTNGDGKVDKSVSFGIVCTEPETKTCWVQTLGNADNYLPATRIKGLYKLSAQEAEKYLNGDGVEFRVVRKGTEVYLFVEGEEVAIFDLTQNKSGVKADTKAKVSLRHYDAEGDVVLPFTVSDKVEKVEIDKIFKDNEKWDLTKQYEGVVSLPGGGTDTSLQFFKKYQNIDLTITAKENDKTGKKPGRTDVLFEFDLNNDGTMDKNVSFGVVQLSNGSCEIQTLGWNEKFIPEKRINALYQLDYGETLKYKNEGIGLRVVRYGADVFLYVDGKQVAVFDLTQNNSGVKADSKATVILRHYDAVAENVVIPFKVTDQVTKPEVAKPAEKIFKDNFKWDLSKQLEGVVSLPDGGTQAVEFCDKYSDIDLTLKNVKEHDTTGKKPGRTDVLFEFDTNGDNKIDKSVSFGIVCSEPETDTCWVQTLGNADNFLPATRIKGLYKLNAQEAEKYLNGDGVEFRVVRKGTEVYLFVEGDEVAIFDLTQNNSGVKADTKAEVSLRHYDAEGNVVLPFTVTDKVDKVEIDKVFKDNEKWDLTKQYEGVASLPGGGTDTSLQLFKKYQNIDLTITAKENDTTGKKPGRTDVLFEFDLDNDGTMDKNVSFGVVQLGDGSCEIQTLGWDKKFIPEKRINALYQLDYGETLKYKNEGIQLRVVRYGADVFLHVDGKQVAVFDLTQNNSGVKADSKATVILRHYDAVADKVDIPFTVTNEISKVTITDNSPVGKVVAKSACYFVGTEIVLSGELDGYYLTDMKVDGELVALNADGTCKFKATKDNYTVEGIFTEEVFVNNTNWNLLQQNQGTVEVNFVEATKGVVTLPNGGNAYNSNNLGGLKLKDKYTNIDLNLVVRDYDDSKKSYARTDVLFEFDGGETVSFGVTKTGNAGDEANWTYRVQSTGCTLNNWKTLRNMTEDEIALYTGEGGIDFRILRNGTSFYVYLGGKLAKSYDFKNKISADTKATVTLRHYDDAGVQVDIPFTVADEVKSIFTTKGAWGGTWNIANQFGGSVSVNATGNTAIPFAEKYTDVDLTLKVKENGTTAKPGRTDVLFEFENGKNISFGVLCTDKSNGKYYIQALNSANNIANAGKIIFDRGVGFYQLSAEEGAKYEKEGIEFRIVRSGTVVYLFIEGRQVAVCNLNYNNSGVTASTKATLQLRHYDVTGALEFPFSISNSVKEADVNITSSGMGTLTKNKVCSNGNKTNPIDITKHFVGETIILTATPESEEYGCTQLLVNGKDVTADMVVNIDGTATYALKVLEKNYDVEATFAKLIFADNYNKSIWDASTQLEGVVSLPNGGGGTPNPLRFYKPFVNVALSLTVRDYPYAGNAKEDARTDVEFVFRNGETITFGVVLTGGSYRIQTRGGTLLSWKTPYYITDENLINSYVITQGELSQENPGGLDFRIVRSGTEFYLYIEDVMVKGYDFSQKIASDTQVDIYLRHYDDVGGNVEIPFTITDEVDIEDPRLFTEKSAVTDYAYSFAVLPDIQIVTENDAVNGENNLAKLFDWIVANEESKRIQYVFGLGDITDNNNEAEWTLAQTQHAKLTTAGIPYSAIRGNHDLPWYRKDKGAANYNTDDYTAYMGTTDYRAQFEGFYKEDNIANSWRTLTVGSVKYLLITLDYGASDEVLNWASDIIYQHPDHNVIITTHAYLYRDGTTLDDGDLVPPSKSGGVNDGDDVWEKLVSKHENIVLVMSGHDPSENIVVNNSEGDNGNNVVSMLIDAQDVEADEGSMGMVAMLYFSEDGKNVTVEYYSTAKEKYFKSVNQFEIELDVVEKDDVVYGQGYVPVQGQQVKTQSAFASFPRTIEVTFNRNSDTTRQVLFGNCGGSSNDYFNLEAPENENIIYLNLCLGGTTFQHSFNEVSVPTNEISRVTVVIEDVAVKCYVNGVLAQTRTTTNGSNGSKQMSKLWEKVPYANLSNIYAVGSDLRDGFYFNGTIYDIALWSDARTADEVAASTILDVSTDSYQDNLLAAYNFRAGYSSSATDPFKTDLSDNGNKLTGTLNVATNATPVLGAYSKISTGKGSSYPAIVSDAQKKTLSQNPYTVSTWIHLQTNVSEAAGVILGNYSGSVANLMNFEISTNGNPRFYHRNSSNKYDSLVFENVDIRSNTSWTHLAYTVSGNKVSCYVNGVLRETLEASNTIQLESIKKDYVIGGDFRSGNSRAFKGRILELDLYEGVLSADKIMKLYSEGKDAVSTGKISY